MATLPDEVKNDSVEKCCGGNHTEHKILTQRNFSVDTNQLDWNLLPAYFVLSMNATLPRLTILFGLVFLTACGGNPDAATAPATTLAASASSVTHMPVADCEPQGCHGLRIIDSNAETFRADAARRDALALAVAKLDNGAAPAQ